MSEQSWRRGDEGAAGGVASELRNATMIGSSDEVSEQSWRRGDEGAAGGVASELRNATMCEEN
ncbi:MAG TPA: hypothetical protein VK908_06885 [Jiangellales bacterium]|nr:hypothetical protein [Jiangellales bacterium]